MSLVANTKSRNLDYQYDPSYIFSTEKDYYKAGLAAARKNAKYAVRPIFYSMFSTLPNVPRYKLVRIKSEQIVPFVKKSNLKNLNNKTSVHSEFLKFFKSSHSKANLVPELQIPVMPEMQKAQVPDKTRSVKVQTKYRESSVQTSPWEPDYVVACDEKETPDLLKLNFLKWGSGLPCGAHEVLLIQRARMKREWEKNLPSCDTAESIAKRTALIAAMERDEYCFRELEIQEIQDLRLHLLELMLQELHDKSHERSKNKLKHICQIKELEKNEKLAKVKKIHDREHRRLTSHFNGTIDKYHRVNVIDEYIHKSSERYAPLIRHGEDPKRWHQVIDEHNKLYQAKFRDVHKYNTIPKWLYDATKIKSDTLKLPGTRLCIRETKWTDPVLKNLHLSLKNLNKHIRKNYSLRVKIDKVGHRITTPEVDSITDAEEELHQASVLIQSILRGRATQKLIYDGRDRCNELIQELKSTQALLKQEQKKIFAKKVDVLYQQREHELCMRSALRIKEGLKKIQGSVIGTILDFLSKELRRLLEERKAHAMCLLHDRERQIREATEAHRRQLELRRRLEHDEIFKQVIKVHQDTVDMYLQDIITEGMDFTSEEDAARYVKNLGRKIDAGMDAMEEPTENEEQELVADLIHNFVLPEVQKQCVRQKIKKRQAKYLQTVHDAIYSHIEHLPKVSRDVQEGVVISSNFNDKTQQKVTDLVHKVDFDISLDASEKISEEKDRSVELQETAQVKDDDDKQSDDAAKKIKEIFKLDLTDDEEENLFEFDDTIVEEHVQHSEVRFFTNPEEFSEEEIVYE